MPVQSVLIDRDIGPRNAVKLLEAMGYKFKKVDITKNYYRFRQQDPDELEKNGYKKFITVKLNKFSKAIIQY